MKNGGQRPNAGRKRGGKNKSTLEKQAIQDAFNQRVMIHADSLFNAQLALATGSIQIFERYEVGSGKNKKTKFRQVSDTQTIIDVLDENEGLSGEVDGTYYKVTQIMPDNRAIESMLNRALGKPKESMDLTSNGKDLIPRKFVVEVVNDNTGKRNKNQNE